MNTSTHPLGTGHTYSQWLKMKAGIHATWFLLTFVNILLTTLKY